jgi:hypothetical protein
VAANLRALEERELERKERDKVERSHKWIRDRDESVEQSVECLLL